MPPRAPARYNHPIDDAWRRRVLARIEEKGWSMAEVGRRLARNGVKLSHSALSLTLHSGQAGSRYKLEIERVLDMHATADEATADSPSKPTPASHDDAVPQSPPRIASNFPSLVSEAAALDDDQVAAVLAVIRAIRGGR